MGIGTVEIRIQFKFTKVGAVNRNIAIIPELPIKGGRAGFDLDPVPFWKADPGLFGSHENGPMFGQLHLQPVNILIAGNLLPPKSIGFNPFRLNVLLPEQFF